MRRLVGVPLAVEQEALEAFLLVAGPRVLASLPADAEMILPHAGKVGATQRTAHAWAAAARARPGLGERVQAPGEAFVAAPQDRRVAVVSVSGELVSSPLRASSPSGDFVSYSSIAEQVRAAAADPAVAGIVLNLDTPGGEIHGVMDAAEAIREANAVKPVVACANPYALSAGYWLASAAGQVVVPETGRVGSVGVYAAHLDQSMADAAAGLRYTFVSAGKHKLDGNPHDALSDGARARMQESVDQGYDLFTQAVASSRPGLSVEQLRELGAVRLGGQQAVDAGLADQVGNLQAAIRLAAEPRAPLATERPSGRAFPVGRRARAFPSRRTA